MGQFLEAVEEICFIPQRQVEGGNQAKNDFVAISSKTEKVTQTSNGSNPSLQVRSTASCKVK